MASSSPSPTIVHRPADAGTEGRFDLQADGKTIGHLSYTLSDDKTMDVEYVEVDARLRGGRLGEQLVGAAVDWARANGRKVVPWCSYARAVMRRTRAHHDVLGESTR